MLSTIDWLVIGAYAAALLIICLRVMRRSPDTDELFLAGRSLGPAVIGLSLFASNISSTTLIGLPGAAWEYGIAVANYEWMAALVLVLTALFLLPRLIGQRLSTIPELLEQRFDPRLRRYLSACSLFLSVALDTAGSLYAGAIVVMLFVPGFTLAPTIFALALLAGLYTTAGGLRAVAYTDVLQSLVLLGGSVLLTWLVLAELNFDFPRIIRDLGPERLSLLRPIDDPSLPWLGTLIGLPVLGFYYWTMNQYVAQRLLGARDITAAARGSILAAALKLLPLFIMVFPGAMAVLLIPDLDSPDQVFPELIRRFAPPGVAGLLIAGLLAAIMSSVDSTLNSASTLIMVDFVKPARPQISSRSIARLGRFCTLGLMLLAALWAPMIDRFSGLFAYLQQTFAYVTPPLVAVFLIGVSNQSISANAAWRGLITGHALSALVFIAAQLGWHSVHFTIVAGLLCAATAVFIVFWQLVGDGQKKTSQESAKPAYAPLSPGLKRCAYGLIGVTLLIVAWLA
ncbi:SLC5 family protein [Congregibacter sp.]|jgi:SSS family solute:Na+ symporter|uniref:SLC5 family protein n=1 Tax=Congregibacter sp. TaxID=2744308 RepID=UPI0039E3D814